MKSSLLINIPGQETFGRYVIVQMNSPTYLNLQEVKAFGRALTGNTAKLNYTKQTVQIHDKAGNSAEEPTETSTTTEKAETGGTTSSPGI